MHLLVWGKITIPVSISRESRSMTMYMISVGSAWRIALDCWIISSANISSQSQNQISWGSHHHAFFFHKVQSLWEGRQWMTWWRWLLVDNDWCFAGSILPQVWVVFFGRWLFALVWARSHTASKSLIWKNDTDRVDEASKVKDGCIHRNAMYAEWNLPIDSDRAQMET